MKPWLRWMMLVGALIGAPVAAREELAVSAAQQTASRIRTGIPAVVTDRLDIRLPARVAVPNDRLRVVGARVPGIVASLVVGEGEPVTAGQTLAELHSPELAAMESEHLAAMSRFALAAAAMKRDRELNELGIIARRRFEDTEAQWREAQVALDHSRTRLRLAGLDHRQVQELERTRRSTGTLAVTAPISGVVLAQSANAGQQVTLDSPLYTLADLRALWLEIHAPQAVAARVRLGDRVRVDNGAVAGEIIAVGRQIHETDQGVLLRARVVPGETVLLPGQFVEVALGVKDAAGALHEVPAAALAYLDGAAHVFVQTPTGFRPVPVTVVSENGDRRIVQGAIAANDPVAVAGVAALKALASGMGGGVMLAGLVRFALGQRLLVFLGVVLLAGAGAWVMTSMPIDAYPDISTTQVKMVVKVAGLTPEEMETRVSAPIEVEMLGIPHQVMLRSTTKYALADITIDFEEGTDIYWARQQVAERLNGVWDRLPADVTGGIAPMTTPLGEMLMFTVDGEGVSLAERRSVLDWVIRPALRTVPGVADVNALGGEVRSFEVVPDIERLAAHGISLAQLRETLAVNNRNDGAGRLSEGEEAWLVRSEGSVRNLADLAGIVVRPDPVEPVRLADVAAVREGALTRYGGVTHHGRGETVEGLVLGLRGANAREVVRGVRAKLDALAPSLPEGVQVSIFYDRGDLVDRAVHTVSRALIEAVVLVLVLLVLFLGDLRAALTVALILPLSALATFLCMRYFGLTANLMSLGGLAIAIGMLVDAAVVMVENVVTHLAHQRDGDRLPRLHVIYRSAREVAAPTTAGILIIVIVFLPLLSLQGLEGKLFMPVAATIVFALTSSLLLSLTVIPVLASVLLGRVSHVEPFLVRLLHRAYTPVLHWALGHAAVPVTVALGLLVLAGVLYTQVGKTFMPTLDEGTVIVQLEKLPSITLEESLAVDQRVQQALMRLPEVVGVVARTGSDELGLDPMGLNETDSFLQLKPPTEWRMATKDALLAALREQLDGFAGLNYVFNQPIEMRVSEMLTGVRGDLAVKIFGPDHATLTRLAHQIGAVLQTIPGAEDVYIPASEGALYFRLVPDRLALGRLGLSIEALQDQLRMLVEGWPAGIVYEGDRRIALVIRGDADLRRAPGDFLAQQVVLPDGRWVPLANLVSVERTEGPVAIKREQGVRNAVAIANVGGRDLVGFVAEAQARIAQEVSLPSGYTIAWGGEFENQQRAAQRLAIVVPLAVGLVFLLLFSTFGSVRQAVLVLTNIPFAMIGGIAALWATGEYLSVPASVGFIALLGIAVLNGVVMVSYFNQLRAAGRSLETAVIEGAQRRLRPVLMTASIAALGLVPLLFATGPGSEIQRPLAIVVIGGLVSSTLLTLLLLPILYRRFGEARS